MSPNYNAPHEVGPTVSQLGEFPGLLRRLIILLCHSHLYHNQSPFVSDYEYLPLAVVRLSPTVSISVSETSHWFHEIAYPPEEALRACLDVMDTSINKRLLEVIIVSTPTTNPIEATFWLTACLCYRSAVPLRDSCMELSSNVLVIMSESSNAAHRISSTTREQA